jgi:hypothetical protein
MPKLVISGQSGLMQGRQLLTQHFFAGAAAPIWEGSIFTNQPFKLVNIDGSKTTLSPHAT